ncbi:ATP synthase F0 subunit B [Candidatus Uhrbacteria bacterium]|nr:ATP synthase F0 subunit B [Candidatus Uhrbacteria bacterium]
MTEPASIGLLASLGINAKLFYAQLINFGIVMLIVWRWVYRPLLKAMDRRNKKIEEGLMQAEQIKKDRLAFDQEHTKLIKAAHEEAHKIMHAADEEAKQQRQTLIMKTQQEIERMERESKTHLEQEQIRMLRSLKSHVAELVIQTTEKILPSVLDKNHRQELMEQAAKEIK